ncbi:Nn.00g066030.m01.CDS01 [Neocucurbitaria sp. VM-36]
MANSVSQQDSNPSYAKLKRDLEDDVTLLNFLPFRRATFQAQTELGGAGPDRLLYGEMKEEKGDLWIYYTLHRKGSQMLAFYTLRGAKQDQAPIRPTHLKHVALPSLPFKHAQDHFQILAIAKYFFIRHGIDDSLSRPLSVQPFRDDLLRVCRTYETIYKQNQAKKAGALAEPPSRVSPSQSICSSSYAMSKEVPRKREHSPDQHYDHQREPITFPSYSRAPPLHQSPPVRLTNADRDALVDQYISLQAHEDELDGKLEEVEAERADVGAKLAEIQADLNALNDRKWDLEDQKGKVWDEKKRLQSSLGFEEQLEFGFEVGRQMERKRLRKI